MTIGPALMMRTDEMSVRFGIKTRFDDIWAQKKGAPARVPWAHYPAERIESVAARGGLTHNQAGDGRVGDK